MRNSEDCQLVVEFLVPRKQQLLQRLARVFGRSILSLGLRSIAIIVSNREFDRLDICQ